MKLLRNLLVGFCIAFLLVSAGIPLQAVTSRDNRDRFVRIPVELMGQVEESGIRPIFRQSYESFEWLELDTANLNRLNSLNIPYQEAPLAGQVRVNGYFFDPIADGEPQLPTALGSESESQGLRLIQFHGPIHEDWLSLLKNFQLKVLQYYPSNTYLVWGTSQQAQRATELAPVRWVGNFYPAYRLSARLEKAVGVIRNVAVTFYNDGQIEATLAQITRLGGSYLQHFPAQADGLFYTAIYSLDASALVQVANLPAVWGLEYASPAPAFDDENGAQIIAGNTPGGNPVTGFYDWLAAKGVDGSGITWADVDTGINSSHPDITGRVSAYVSYAGAGSANTDGDGHGSHTAGAIFGDGKAGTGITDPSGFYWGAGAAPEANLVVQNALVGTSWPPSGGWDQLSADSVLNGAIGSSNSWYTGSTGSVGYSSAARTHDLMVRDANFDTASSAEPIIMVFSAGNSGPTGTSITEPKEAKNLIVVGASSNYPRVGTSIDNIAYFSSRGPAQDGRILPTVMAPGYQTTSFIGNAGSSSCTSTVSGSGASYYTYCSGTSMAAPFVSGASALIADWWAQEGRGIPSPAMVKALLMNGATSMVGGDDGNSGLVQDIPNNQQGWGRVNLDEVIYPALETIYRDQVDVLSNTGETFTLNVGVADPTKPLKISLVWSDAAGAINANPALVNDLNLKVVSGSATYFGNQFTGGWSQPVSSVDSLNNLENVFIQAPGEGATITVQAVNIAGDGIPYNADTTDQDFALVCSNCDLTPDFNLTSAQSSLAVCAPNVAEYGLEVGSIAGFNEAVTLSVGGNPAGTTAVFSANPVTPSGSSILTIGNVAAGSGSYSLNVQGTSSTKSHAIVLGLTISAGSSPDAPVAIAPVSGAVNQATTLDLSWAGASSGQTYTVEIATDHDFNTVVKTLSGITSNSTTVSGLLSDTQYFWRVTASNACGANQSLTFTFSTALSQEVCHNLSLAIPDSSTTGASDTITNPGTSTIVDLDVRTIASHTYIGDLKFTLSHDTTATSVVLIDRPGAPSSTYGCSNNHIRAVLNDEASSLVESQCASSTNANPPPYAIDGTFIPNNPLSAFDGQSLTGGWTLNVTDAASPDTGTLTQWCLIFGGNPADYGDLPGSYGVAWHLGNGELKLGNAWDADTSAGTGEDNASDDGVLRTNAAWVTSGTTQIFVTANGAGWLVGWVDWNNNGWFDLADKVVDLAITTGQNTIPISIPATYSTGSSVNARFRLYPSQPTTIGPGGSAGSGEVEDYQWSFTPTAIGLKASRVGQGWELTVAKVAGVSVVLTAGLWLFLRNRRRIVKPNEPGG